MRHGGRLTVKPMEGILPGQAAFINLAGERPREMVIETPAALTIRLEGVGGRSFPGSLMGVIAYVKQIFLDADHYDAAWSVYETNPLGLERPTYDRSLEPLVEALVSTWAPRAVYLQRRHQPAAVGQPRPGAQLLRGEAAPPEVIVEEGRARFAVDVTAPEHPRCLR